MVVLWYPVVLVHGFMDVPDLTGVWEEAGRILRKHKINYFIPQIPSYGSIAERTESLINQIEREFPGRTDGKDNYVHIFGHSMGGINARDVAYWAHRGRYGSRKLNFKVKTVTTFGTPHRGVKAIDRYTISGLNNAFASALSRVMGSDAKAFINLSAKFMEGFNASTPNADSVRYFSWAGNCDYARGLTSPCWAFTKWDGPTDGAVNVDSAKLEHGTHLGTLPGTDHLTITDRTDAIENTLKHLDAAEYSDGRKCDVFLSINTGFGSGVLNHAEDTVKSVTNLATAPLRFVESPVQTTRKIAEKPFHIVNGFSKGLGFGKVF